MIGIMETAKLAYLKHRGAAEAAFHLYRSYCGGNVPARVPGMDTVFRLAVRIDCGKTIEQAAAREYLYRWHLAIKEPDQCGLGACDDVARNPCVSVFGAPHTIGL